MGTAFERPVHLGFIDPRTAPDGDPGPVDMARQPAGAVQGRQNLHGDQPTVSFGQSPPLPNDTEKHLGAGFGRLGAYFWRRAPGWGHVSSCFFGPQVTPNSALDTNSPVRVSAV